MLIEIDFESDIPIYIQLKIQIIEAIAKGDLKDGDSLPSVRSLGQDVGINLHTVNKTYTLLKDEGYIKLDRRKGTMVNLDFFDTNTNFKEKLDEEISSYVAECINRKITKEEIVAVVNKYYEEYNRGDD